MNLGCFTNSRGEPQKDPLGRQRTPHRMGKPEQDVPVRAEGGDAQERADSYGQGAESSGRINEHANEGSRGDGY